MINREHFITKRTNVAQAWKADTYQPRALPWVLRSAASRALKGRDMTPFNSMDMFICMKFRSCRSSVISQLCSTLTGCNVRYTPSPRALPWADMCRPFRPKPRPNHAQYQKHNLTLKELVQGGRSSPQPVFDTLISCFQIVTSEIAPNFRDFRVE